MMEADPAAGDASTARAWTAVGPRDAPAIVLLHATRLSRHQWWPQLRRLARRYRCVAVDLPGHGTSAEEPFSMEAATAVVERAIREEVPSGRAVLVGLSLGGYVAIEVAERAPDRVAGLVIAGCSAEPIGPTGAMFRAFVWLLEHVPAGALTSVNRAFFRVRYGRTVADAIGAGGYWFAGGALAVRVLLGTRFLDRLGRLWTPVLVVNGALDPVFGPGGAPWAAACRRGRHAVIPRATHLSSLDRPGAFSDLVAAFVEDPAGDA